MHHEEMLSSLLDAILSLDLSETDIYKLHDGLEPQLRVLAGQLHVAKTEIHIEYDPNVYDIRGRVLDLVRDYHDERSDQPLVLHYPRVNHTTGVTTVYPWAGYVWNAEEEHAVRAVIRLLSIVFGRAAMLGRERKMPYIDQLTGLSNSPGVAYFGARMEERFDMSEYAGCFINLKNFKYINNQLGNPGGDEALRQYAFRLYDFLQPAGELIARLGGDNFFALVRKEHLEQFLSIAVSLNLTLGSGEQRRYLPLSAWVGVYQAKEGDHAPSLLLNASFAYEQARKSRITICYFDPATMRRSLHEREVSQTFPEALRGGDLICCYQPKVYMSTGELYGCEALVRWMRDGTLVPPSEFVPIAEASGLVDELDRYMLRSVCRDLRSWLDAGIEPVCVSVNYSQHDFYNESLIEETLETIHKYNIDGKYLEIEITESSFFENVGALERFIKVMHENGIKVSLDDFGTGYSSLNMLKSLDLDTVKLDKSFFDNLSGDNENDRVMLRSIADMLNQLHKTAISEGVETPEQIDFAREIGCDIIQGYFFDKPLSYEEFTERLKSRHYAKADRADAAK